MLSLVLEAHSLYELASLHQSLFKLGFLVKIIYFLYLKNTSVPQKNLIHLLLLTICLLVQEVVEKKIVINPLMI